MMLGLNPISLPRQEGSDIASVYTTKLAGWTGTTPSSRGGRRVMELEMITKLIPHKICPAMYTTRQWFSNYHHIWKASLISITK